MSPVNLDTIQSWIDQGRLDPSATITMRELSKSRCIHGVKRHGVKLLGRVRSIPDLQTISYPQSLPKWHHGKPILPVKFGETVVARFDAWVPKTAFATGLIVAPGSLWLSQSAATVTSWSAKIQLGTIHDPRVKIAMGFVRLLTIIIAECRRPQIRDQHRRVSSLR